MNHSKVAKWARRVVWIMLLAVPAVGCSPLQVIGFMFARPEKTPPPYPLTFGEDSAKKDRDEVVVLILAQVAPGTNPQFVTADRELATKLSHLMPEQVKENKEKKKMRVINPTQVDKFKMENPRWKQMSAGDIGKKLEADFVLEIYLDNMRMYQPNSLNNIYEGHADVTVSITEIGSDEPGYKGKYPDQYPLTFAYPKSGVRDASLMSPSEFKKQFLDELTGDIARKHVASRPSDDIATGPSGR